MSKYRYMILLGHGFKVQIIVSSSDPEHSPPYCSSTVFSLLRVCLPVPHGTEQLEYELHSLHWQSSFFLHLSPSQSDALHLWTWLLRKIFSVQIWNFWLDSVVKSSDWHSNIQFSVPVHTKSSKWLVLSESWLSFCHVSSAPRLNPSILHKMSPSSKPVTLSQIPL